ncbi:MAG: hypothetical protein IPO72_15720 [Saprospiraceae bacterium]|nr:hypothetical protein [Candidatus Vicinibacter affinis]
MERYKDHLNTLGYNAHGVRINAINWQNSSNNNRYEDRNKLKKSLRKT